MKGYPIFLTLYDMATLVFCFLAVECQILISSWIMDLDHACTFFTQTFNFRIFELERSFFCVPLRYLCVSFKSMAIAKHRSQHNFAQFSSDFIHCVTD